MAHASDQVSEFKTTQASAMEELKPESISSKWTYYLPYVPEKNEYNFEIGGMWEEENLSWLGLTYGRHLSRCFFINDISCQQYLDLTAGAGAREGYNDGLLLAGLRWQYVSFPKPYSPSFKIFGGAMNVHDDERDRQVGVYGIGFSLTTTLHKKLNVKWENRIGGGDRIWTQSMLSLSLSIHDWVEDFGEGVSKIGGATYDATKKAIKSTIEAPKTFKDWFSE